MIRFGIIGTNWITERFIAAAKLHKEFELAAIYSRTEERAREFADKHQIAHSFTELNAMFMSGVIDAVYIASPNSYHSEQSILAMNNGIHVLCEKPAASNVRELNEMIEAAKRNNVLLMEAVKSTLMPGFKAVKENIGRIGAVRRYFANFCQYSSRYDAYKEGTVMNSFKPELSNGSLVDIGVYCIYPAVALFGRPKSVKATGYLLESGVDGEGSILLEYETMDAVLLHSKISNSSMINEIQGEDCNMIINKISEPTRIELNFRDGIIEDISRPTIEHTMFYELEEFISLIKAGRTESTVNTFEVSLITMEIMDEARRQMGVRFPADQTMN
ncbi:Gfo/Idh/MocA family oxidoreductase [Paenibacillus sp. GSMTC-2017]|uniref:Gfo/Idh/MocA family protein n=1 Tax=Paenibacillus sp. GSMTC-2017 TaxID=2794350 RepID=UPI0018D785C0|nr:Gfo/Idh/MocA family oxidoreductase [Paenibacillus sp. GSMTC-2017]MBH5319969.1 Gfo/Idh/MocA family oxidoreductase [Paenibacillus sp. GSMTC-2017]